MATTEPKVIITALTSVADQVVRKVALDIVAELVKPPPLGGTPVDTGWARNNWSIQIGTPREAPIGSRDQAGAARGAQEASKGSVLGYTTASADEVYITNNVPYITRLNEGTSQQAPKGFVQQAIRRAIDKLSELSQ